MNDYTVYCTNEQTKKALELGAPINYEVGYVNGIPFKVTDEDGEPAFIILTAEQMHSWIMDNGAIDFYTDRDLDEELNYINTYGYLVAFSDEDRLVGAGINSYTEATLAAIDDALDYLTNMEKKKQ